MPIIEERCDGIIETASNDTTLQQVADRHAAESVDQTESDRWTPNNSTNSNSGDQVIYANLGKLRSELDSHYQQFLAELLNA